MRLKLGAHLALSGFATTHGTYLGKTLAGTSALRTVWKERGAGIHAVGDGRNEMPARCKSSIHPIMRMYECDT